MVILLTIRPLPPCPHGRARKPHGYGQTKTVRQSQIRKHLGLTVTTSQFCCSRFAPTHPPIRSDLLARRGVQFSYRYRFFVVIGRRCVLVVCFSVFCCSGQSDGSNEASNHEETFKGHNVYSLNRPSTRYADGLASRYRSRSSKGLTRYSSQRNSRGAAHGHTTRYMSGHYYVITQHLQRQSSLTRSHLVLWTREAGLTKHVRPVSIIQVPGIRNHPVHHEGKPSSIKELQQQKHSFRGVVVGTVHL